MVFTSISVNPNAMPEVLELGAFPQTSSAPMVQTYLPNVNAPPPSYSQSVNAPVPQIPTPNLHVVINLQLGPYPASIQCMLFLREKQEKL